MIVAASGQELIGKYEQKKRGNEKLLGMIGGHVPENTAETIGMCGTWLLVATSRGLERKKLLSSNFCKNRFCPMCAWRKACKDALRLMVLLAYIRQEYSKEFVFLTLTAPNVAAADLAVEISRYNQNFRKLMKRDGVVRVVKGYIRKLEVTYNSKRDDYHPHFHVLLAVNASYFTDRTYIKHERWLELWQQAMGDESITQVDVRKLKSDTGNEVRELAKYAAKDGDYLLTQAVFDVFYWTLKGRQVVTYSRLFTEANKLYKDKALDYLKGQDEVEYVYRLLYRWGIEGYGLESLRKLTDAEKVRAVMAAVLDMEE